MPDFTYEAMMKSGAKSTGTVTAGSEREAAGILDARGLFPIVIKMAGGSSQAGGGLFGGGVSRRVLATSYSQLADLLHSGVPLLRSIELLERQTTNKRLAAVMRDVRMKVADGTGLAQAMAAHPNVFDELAVSMVRAGQEGGFLEDVLKRVAVFVEQQEDLKSKVVGALAYPAFLAIARLRRLERARDFLRAEVRADLRKARGQRRVALLTEQLLAFSHFQQSIWGVLTAILAFVGLDLPLPLDAKAPGGKWPTHSG